jgi:hypothetical protein
VSRGEPAVSSPHRHPRRTPGGCQHRSGISQRSRRDRARTRGGGARAGGRGIASGDGRNGR